MCTEYSIATVHCTGDPEQVSVPQSLLDKPVDALFWQNCKRKDAFSSPSVWMHYRAVFHQVLLPPTLKLPRLPGHALTCASRPLYFKNKLSYAVFYSTCEYVSCCF